MEILKELFYLDIAFFKSKLTECPEYMEVLNKMFNEEQKLTDVLSDKQSDIFEEFCELQAEVSYLKQRQNFIDGFKLGAGIILETLEDKQ